MYRKYLVLGLLLIASIAGAIAGFSIYRGWQFLTRHNFEIGLGSGEVEQKNYKEMARRAYLGTVEKPIVPVVLYDVLPSGVRIQMPEVLYASTTTDPAVTLASDSLGLRVLEPRNPVTSVDMLVVGGSHVLGHGLNYEDLFSSIVAKSKGYALANAGVGGYGGAASLLRLDGLLPLSPKLIVYGLFEDHMYRDVAVQPGRPGLTLSEEGAEFRMQNVGPLVSGNQMLPPFLGWLRSDLSGAILFQARCDFAGIRSKFGLRTNSISVVQRYDREQIDRYNSCVRPPHLDKQLLPVMIDAMSFILRSMNARAREVGAKFIVVYFPTLYPPGEFTPAAEEWLALAKGENFTFIDVSSFIRPFVEKGTVKEITVSDGHYNARVNAHMADKILQALDRN